MTRKIFMLLATVAVAACARKDEKVAADSPAAASIPALTFADFAGRWNLQLLGDVSDSVLATYALTAIGDSAAWTLQPPGSEPVPVGTAVKGDSLLFDAGTYKSSAPPSYEITTHGAGRLEGGKLVGWYESRYAKAAGDTVIRGRLRGTRRP